MVEHLDQIVDEMGATELRDARYFLLSRTFEVNVIGAQSRAGRGDDLFCVHPIQGFRSQVDIAGSYGSMLCLMAYKIDGNISVITGLEEVSKAGVDLSVAHAGSIDLGLNALPFFLAMRQFPNTISDLFL